MRAADRFHVEQSIPPSLASLRRLAMNLQWTWNPHAPRRLLAAPIRSRGSTPARTPSRLLDLITQERWEQLAADQGFVDEIAALDDDLTAALEEPRWFQHHGASAHCGSPPTSPPSSG